MEKKGVSPVIATVLLIIIIVVIGLIIFLWLKGITQETITKFGGTNIELICNDVNFDASYSGNKLSIYNIGNVPIFGIKAKIIKEGSHTTKDLIELSEWPEAGLNQGGIFSGSIGDVEGVNEIILTPILMGASKKGDKSFICDEKQHGYEIIL